MQDLTSDSSYRLRTRHLLLPPTPPASKARCWLVAERGGPERSLSQTQNPYNITVYYQWTPFPWSLASVR